MEQFNFKHLVQVFKGIQNDYTVLCNIYEGRDAKVRPSNENNWSEIWEYVSQIKTHYCFLSLRSENAKIDLKKVPPMMKDLTYL